MSRISLMRGLLAVLAATLVYGTAAASPSGAAKHVSANSVSISFPTSIAANATVANFPLRVNGSGESIPARAVLFSGYTVPGNTFFPPTIWVIPTNLSKYRKISGVDGKGGLIPQIAQIKSLLHKRPALSHVSLIPYVLPALEETEILAAKKHYVSFKGGSGVSFVTAMGLIDTLVTNASPVRWEFRGITTNGKYLVAAEFPLFITGLPKKAPKLGLRQQAALTKGWKTYVAHLVRDLEKRPDARYDPPLNTLTSIIRTLNVSK